MSTHVRTSNFSEVTTRYYRGSEISTTHLLSRFRLIVQEGRDVDPDSTRMVVCLG